MLKNVVLTGFMGTGKTEIGKALARQLGYEFIDTDVLIEKREHQSISKIFQDFGEAYFRKVEKKIIRSLSNRQGLVIATGGGAVVDPQNVTALRKRGFLIGLKAQPKIIHSRLERHQNRPLLDGQGRIKQIGRMLEIRQPYYDRADFMLRTDQLNVKEASRQVQRWLLAQLAQSIKVNLPQNPYEIKLGWGILNTIGDELKQLGKGKKVAVVTNPVVRKIYGAMVLKSLKRAGLAPFVIEIPEGERFKTVRSVNSIHDELIKNRFERGSCLLALGGGVIGDIAGFAAATYLRGIPYIQVPTTLIAQVDSSIGGKTGVNHPQGKNLIGAFYQPCLVFSDVKVLETLDRRNYLSGLAEVVKYGVIADAEFFNFLEEYLPEIMALNPAYLLPTIRRSSEIKAKVVQEDEKEAGKRKILNYGHTLGHALEAVTAYRKYLHGEAISIGMVFAAKLARKLGLCSQTSVDRQQALLIKAGLPVTLPHCKPDDILRAMFHDKKVAGGEIHFVLADRIGHVLVKGVKASHIKRLL
jgi:shikimate kinase / 3-dehydroquinate synthase